MAQTNRLNLRYPAGTDTPDIPRDINNLAADLESLIPRNLFSVLQQGAVGSGHCAVTAGAGMTVNIAAGIAMVPDADTFGAIVPVFKAAQNGVVISAANGTNPRIDQIVMDMDGNITVVAGAPTAGATLDNRSGAGALPASNLRLADILIPAASASISAGNIRDRRSWARGGYAYRGDVGAVTVSASGTAAIPNSTLRLETMGNPVSVHIMADPQLYGGSSLATFMTLQMFDNGVNVLNQGFSTITAGGQMDFDLAPKSYNSPAAGSHLFTFSLVHGGQGQADFRPWGPLHIREILGNTNGNGTT